MKKLFLALLMMAIVLSLTTSVWAEGFDSLSLKQGAIINWKDGNLDNISTGELARTHEVASWGRWNALWVGWTLDAGIAYDANAIDKGALLIGREFGTIGKYIPIDFPLKDKISITIYPIGLYVENLTEDKPKFSGCSGGAIVKLEVKF